MVANPELRGVLTVSIFAPTFCRKSVQNRGECPRDTWSLGIAETPRWRPLGFERYGPSSRTSPANDKHQGDANLSKPFVYVLLHVLRSTTLLCNCGIGMRPSEEKKIEGRLTSDEPSMLLLRPTRETITRMYFSSVRQEDYRSPVIEDSISAHSQWADPRRPCLRVSILPKSRHLTAISHVKSKCTGSCSQKWVKIQCSRASHPNLGGCQP